MTAKKGKSEFVTVYEYEGGGASPAKDNLASRKVFDLQEQFRCEKRCLKSKLEVQTDA